MIPARKDAMRLLIADDHDLLREMLRDLLAGTGDFEVESACDVDDACRLVEQKEAFDLIMLDWQMPGMNGMEGLRRLRRAAPCARVAIISGTGRRDVMDSVLGAGASGFLPKTLHPDELLRAVRTILDGTCYVPTEIAGSSGEGEILLARLSAREAEVLERLTQGKSNKEIARDLDIREPTVKLHVKTLFSKIGAANRTQAAMIAKEAGLF